VSFAVVVLIARLALVAAIYVFLALVVRALYRDLQAAGQQSGPGIRVGARGVPQLRVLAAGNTPYAVGQAFRLHSPTMLGRDPRCDIPVEDDFVSGKHLRLLQGSRGWQAQDLNSTNGTRVDGVRIKGSVALQSGAVLELGRFRACFVLEQ